ncbi:hypothetical protein [Brevibacillus agri]|uniref:hypothetical protein n=1 Tax=Brevibacillus agri TaxID=51101 RepID=UPI003D1F0E07
MNKKVTLSLLSATVFASMAASAFAAPTQGVYMGGSVDKFYKLDDLFNLSAAAKKQFVVDLNAANPDLDFKNLVFVDFDGKGAKFSEILAAGTLPKAKRDLTKADFEGSYVTVNLDGSNGVSYDPRNDAVDVPTGDLKVESVSAIDAKTLQVTFGQKVNTSAAGTGALNPANYFIDNQPLAAFDGGTPVLTLSPDGKAVTITLDTATLTNDTSYAVVIDGIEDFLAENAVPKYSTVLKFSDTVRPVLAGVSYVDNITAKVSFSEKVINRGTVTILDQNGKDVTGNFTVNTLGADGKSFTIGLSNPLVQNNVNYTVKVLGVVDLAGNLLDPNPATTTIKKNVTETDAPTVTSVEALGHDKVKVTFSEKLSAPGTISVDGKTPLPINTASGGNATVDASGLVYTITLDATNTVATDGVYSVVLANFVDLNGNTTLTQSKVVNFVGDTTAPAYVSSEVKQIGTKQYLLVKFDDANTLVNTLSSPTHDITGTYVDVDGIEKTATIVAAGNTTLYDPNLTGKSDTIKIDLTTAAAAKGDYSVTLPDGLVKDSAGNPSVAKAITFSLGTASDTVKPVVTSGDITVQGGLGADTVTVHFSKPVERTTALNVNNYLVDGQVAFSKAVFDPDTQTVKLTLKPGAIDSDGNRLVTVKNVKDASNNVMNTVNFVKPFTENVKPTIVSAALVAPDTIELTFSENLVDASIEGDKADADADFVVKSGTDVLTLAATGTVAKNGDSKHYDIKLAAGLTADQLAKALTVQVLSTNNVTDAATVPNGLAATTVTVSK